MKQQFHWKNILVSIVIGALVAFFTALAEGLVEALGAFAPNLLGGATATLIAIAKKVV